MKRQGLLNPDKADLDKDGQLSSYEEARGKAIERNMKGMGGLLDDERERYAEGTPERKEDKLTQESFMQMIANAATQQGLGPAEYKQQIGRRYAQEQLGEVSDETEEHIRQFAVGDIGQEDFFKYFIRDAKALGGLTRLASIVGKKLLRKKPTSVAKVGNRNFKNETELENFLMSNKHPEAVKFTRQELNDIKSNIGGKEEYLDFLTEFVLIKDGDIDYIKRAKKGGASSKTIKSYLETLERNPKAHGGPHDEMDTQMSMLMIKPAMESDEEMEENYIDFIMDEALDDDEQDFLMNELRGNDRLSEVFDKVIEVASEFSGSGPVEGPGSGVSDSIPARLSDGEFVFTAKATEEIGESELMRMMKDAEARADERQTMANGGNVEEEETVTMPVAEQAPRQDIRVTKETVGAQAGMQEQSDLVDEELKKSMLSTRPYVRS
tara:strand:+ start:601 stop:1914 length:1314 start_codon:yes stop_codon:yes gene_type:complete